MDSRRFNRLVEKVRWLRNHKIIHDRRDVGRIKEVDVVSSIREKLSLTREQLADLIGVTVDEVYKWELGVTDPGDSEKIVLWVACNYPDVFLEAAYKIKYEK